MIDLKSEVNSRPPLLKSALAHAPGPMFVGDLDLNLRLAGTGEKHLRARLLLVWWCCGVELGLPLRSLGVVVIAVLCLVPSGVEIDEPLHASERRSAILVVSAHVNEMSFEKMFLGELELTFPPQPGPPRDYRSWWTRLRGKGLQSDRAATHGHSVAIHATCESHHV